MNTHETVTSTGLDNSHDAGKPTLTVKVTLALEQASALVFVLKVSVFKNAGTG